MKPILLLLTLTLCITGVINNNGVYGMFSIVAFGLWALMPGKKAKK